MCYCVRICLKLTSNFAACKKPGLHSKYIWLGTINEMPQTYLLPQILYDVSFHFKVKSSLSTCFYTKCCFSNSHKKCDILPRFLVCPGLELFWSWSLTARPWWSPHLPVFIMFTQYTKSTNWHEIKLSTEYTDQEMVKYSKANTSLQNLQICAKSWLFTF